jgi:hypothetical protein
MTTVANRLGDFYMPAEGGGIQTSELPKFVELVSQMWKNNIHILPKEKVLGIIESAIACAAVNNSVNHLSPLTLSKDFADLVWKRVAERFASAMNVPTHDFNDDHRYVHDYMIFVNRAAWLLDGLVKRMVMEPDTSISYQIMKKYFKSIIADAIKKVEESPENNKWFMCVATVRLIAIADRYSINYSVVENDTIVFTLANILTQTFAQPFRDELTAILIPEWKTVCNIIVTKKNSQKYVKEWEQTINLAVEKFTCGYKRQENVLHMILITVVSWNNPEQFRTHIEKILSVMRDRDDQKNE